MLTVPRRSRRRALLVVPLVAGVVAGLPPFVSASPIEDQQVTVDAITDRLEELEEAADILAEDYVAANTAVEQLRDEIAATEARIAEKSAQTAALRDRLAAMAVDAYMGTGGGINPMFTDLRGATDTLQQDHLTHVALDTGTATTDEYDDALDDLDDERERLADQRDEAADRAEDLAAAKQANDEQKAEYQQARQEAEAELGDLIRDEEERRARESYQRVQREAAAALAAAAPTLRATGAAPTPAASAAAVGGRAQPAAPPPPPPAPAPEAPAVPPTSSRAGIAINAAMTQLGVPWVFAMAEPGVGFDCSGLTSWAWGEAGVSMPHQSRMQFDSLPQVPISDAAPGDLIFYYSPISHVGIYLGDGKLVHAPNSGSVVNVATVNWNKVVGVARPG